VYAIGNVAQASAITFTSTWFTLDTRLASHVNRRLVFIAAQKDASAPSCSQIVGRRIVNFFSFLNRSRLQTPPIRRSVNSSLVFDRHCLKTAYFIKEIIITWSIDFLKGYKSITLVLSIFKLNQYSHICVSFFIRSFYDSTLISELM
jgi:hypothetical protein